MKGKSNMNDALSYEKLAARGWSCRKAALYIGMHPAHLSRIINGERPATDELLQKLAALPQLPPIQVRNFAHA